MEEKVRYYIIRSNEKILSEERQRYIEELIKSIKEDLEKENYEEFLERVLEIRRIQSYREGKWETTKYKLLLTYGSPTVWLDTDGYLEIKEFDSEIVIHIDDDVVVDLWGLEDYLNEISS